jgi:hypothetical protein
MTSHIRGVVENVGEVLWLGMFVGKGIRLSAGGSSCSAFVRFYAAHPE